MSRIVTFYSHGPANDARSEALYRVAGLLSEGNLRVLAVEWDRPALAPVTQRDHGLQALLRGVMESQPGDYRDYLSTLADAPVSLLPYGSSEKTIDWERFYAAGG